MMLGASGRAGVAAVLFACGLAAQTALEHGYRTPRPSLRGPLAALPMNIGSWLGHDEQLDPAILDRAQADEYVNRVYEDIAHPGRVVRLWMNYSRLGLNLRHSPEVCLPSGGWTKVESQTSAVRVMRTQGSMLLTRLTYTQGEELQGIGFWYYIFGEGPLERFSRTLPISSRSSHGRATRGSGLTVEVFFDGARELDNGALEDFVASLLDALDPLLPDNRVCYHIP